MNRTTPAKARFEKPSDPGATLPDMTNTTEPSLPTDLAAARDHTRQAINAISALPTDEQVRQVLDLVGSELTHIESRLADLTDVAKAVTR